MKDFLDMIKLIVSIFIFTFIIWCVIIYPLSKYDCSNKGKIYNVSVEYNISGCFVKFNDKYIPIENYERALMEITNVTIHN